MKTKDFTTSMLVEQSPEEAFKAINNVRGWWSEVIQGGTEKLNDEFTYRHKDMHYSKHRLVEVVPNQKVVWLTLDSKLYFLENQTEWNGTKVFFEILKKGNKTEVKFTHEGLTPECECYEACFGGWSHYLKSLQQLITTGKGHPDTKEEMAPYMDLKV